MVQNPVIIVPGVLCNTLEDKYPSSTQEVWNDILNKDFDRITLHPDNFSYEAIEPALVRPGRYLGLVYDDLVQSLRYELSPAKDLPTPVFVFIYDWRKSLSTLNAELGVFINEVQDRTKLLKHYSGVKRSDLKVDLVAHSMGGLVVTEYLIAQASNKMPTQVNKVVTMATPFKGSIEPIVQLLTGMGILTGTIPSPAERETSRMCPSLYQMLPAFNGAVLGDNKGINTNIFDLEAWQPSLLQTLQEFVRLYAVEDDPNQAENLLKKFLADAKAHNDRMSQFRLNQVGLDPKNWLAIVGLGAQTRTSVTITEKGEQPWFEINQNENVEVWRTKKDPNSLETGDSTVPVLGAVPDFLQPNWMVGVTPDDFDFFELHSVRLLATFHAQIPSINLVQRLVVKFLINDPGSFSGDVHGWALPRTKGFSPPVLGIKQRTF